MSTQTMLGICTVESRVGPAGASVRLSGQLCYSSSPAVRRELIGMLAMHPIRRLDLRDTELVSLDELEPGHVTQLARLEPRPR